MNIIRKFAAALTAAFILAFAASEATAGDELTALNAEMAEHV